MHSGGDCSFAVAAPERQDRWHEIRPPASCSRCTICLRWLPLPPTSSSWGPLLPALWVVYRDVEELLAERGVKVDQHVTVYRSVLRFTRLLAEAARPAGMPLAIAGRSTRDLPEGRKTQ
jgi:hypothetical protein